MIVILYIVSFKQGIEAKNPRNLILNVTPKEHAKRVLISEEEKGKLLELMKNLIMEHAGVSEDTAEKSAVEQAAVAFEKYDSEVKEIECGWILQTDPANMLRWLIDGNAYYNIMVLPNFDENTVYQVTGQFPKTRYFSYQTYSLGASREEGMLNVASASDYDLIPDSGKNPWQEYIANDFERGVYTIHLTRDGDKGLLNERRAIHPNGGSNTCFIIMRLYRTEEGADDTFLGDRNRAFGSVPAPIVKKLADDGKFYVLRDCHMELPYKKEKETYHELRAQYKSQGCHKNRETGRFSVYRGPPYEISENSRPLFSNNDGDYLQYCNNEEDVGQDPLYVVKGKLTSTAQSLYPERGVQVADWEDYEARYVSFTSTDAAAPTVSFKTFCDEDIRQFYSDVEDWDGSYEIVFGATEEFAKGCGKYNKKKQMFLPFIKPDTLYPRSPGVMYREILPRTQRIAIDEGHPITYHVQGPSVGYLKQKCYDEGDHYCYDREAQRSVMGDYFPEIEVYKCPGGDKDLLERLN